MNIFSKLLLVWYSETMLSSWASETSKVSDDAQKFLPSNVTAGDSIVVHRTGKKPEMDSLTHTSGLRQAL